MTIDEVWASLREGWGATATLVTNQADGKVSYARGALHYRAGHSDPRMPFYIGSSLEGELRYLFNDRVLELPNATPFLEDQPFSTRAADQIQLTIRKLINAWSAVITLKSWGNAVVHVPLTDEGELLSGLGDPIAGHASHARYLIALSEPLGL
jgi:hypothetical protein